MSDDYSLTARLAKHLLRDVDDATRTRARLHLLDWIACVVGARGGAVMAAFPAEDPDIAHAV